METSPHKLPRLREFEQYYEGVLIEDQLGLLDLSRINEAAAELVKRGYSVSVITTSDGNDDLTETYYHMLNKNGISPPPHFPVNHFGCMVDDLMGAICLRGDDVRLSVERMSVIEDSLHYHALEALYGDYDDQKTKSELLTNGFVEAFEEAVRMIDAVEDAEEELAMSAKPTEVIEEVASQPIVSYEDEIIVTPTQSYPVTTPAAPIPETSSFFERHALEASIFSATFALIIIGLIAENKLFKPRRLLRREVNRQADNFHEMINGLTNQLSRESGDQLFEKLIDILKDNYPEQVADVEESGRMFRDSLILVLERAAPLQRRVDEIKFFTANKEFNILSVDLQEIIGDITQLLEEIELRRSELLDIGSRIVAAKDNLEKTVSQVDNIREWYLEQLHQYPEYLLSESDAFQVIDLKLNEAQTLFDQGATLKASDQAVILSQSLHQFKLAVEEIIEVRKGIKEDWKIVETLIEKIKEDLVIAGKEFGEVDQFSLALGIDKAIQRAQSSLINDLHFEDVDSCLQAAQGEMLSIIQFCETFSKFLRQRNINHSLIDGITSDGFRIPLSTASKIKSTSQMVIKANSLAINSNWAEAENSLGTAWALSQEALHTMRSLVSLRDQNNINLSSLSQQVSVAETRRKQKIEGLWNELDESYHPDNYKEFINHFSEISSILLELFDDPENDVDLASQAARLNNMEEQNFSGAESVIASMKGKLARSEQLMNELEERYRYVKDAHRDCDSVINSAKRNLLQAEEAKAGEKDRFVDQSVDIKIAKVKELLAQAESLSQSSIYVKALEIAHQASALAVDAKSSADTQVSILRTSYNLLEVNRNIASQGLNTIANEVKKEHSLVVSQKTLNALNEVRSQLERLVDEESSLERFEDTELLSRIKAHIESYKQIENSAVKKVSSLLQSDKASHSEHLNRAKDEIARAKKAIDEAESKCSNSKARNAGSSELQSAKLLLPSNQPEWGTSSTEIDKVIQNSSSARNKAEDALEMAKKAIKKYEDEQKRKEEEERKKRLAESMASSSSGATSGGGVTFRSSASRVSTVASRPASGGGATSGGGKKFPGR